MMTTASDYRLYTPPSGVDIRGEILPVADVDGRTPTIRREDACYLNELACVFRNYTSTNYIPKKGRATSGIRSALPSAGGLGWDGSEYLVLKPDCPMNYSQEATSTLGITQFKAYASANGWFHTPTASQIKSGAPIRADDIRAAYHFLGADYYHRCNENTTTNIATNGILGCTVTPTEWTVPTHSVVNGELVTGTETLSSHNGGRFCSTFSLGGGTYLKKWDGDAKADRYCTFLDVPSLPVSLPVSFDIPATTAYALLSFDVYAGRAKGYAYRSVLREMTAEESGFGLDLFNSSDLSELLGLLGFSSADFGEWTADATSHYCSFSVGAPCFFAKFGQNAYYALPAEWDWSPS